MIPIDRISGYLMPSISAKYFRTSRLSKIAVMIASFGAAALTADWCAAIKYSGDLILWALPIASWYSDWLSMTRLSVVLESNDRVKIFLRLVENYLCFGRWY